MSDADLPSDVLFLLLHIMVSCDYMSYPVFLWGPYCSSVLFFCYVFFVLLIYWFTMLTSLKGAHPDITKFGLN